MRTQLRPIERRVLSLLDAGVDVPEVARRFHRSPPHIARLARLARLDGRNHVPAPTTLRPIERRILHWRSQGESHVAIADRFKRSAESTAQIEALANYKLSR
jgi:ParB-like chromosome segregation protein Spo0J